MAKDTIGAKLEKLQKAAHKAHKRRFIDKVVNSTGSTEDNRSNVIDFKLVQVPDKNSIKLWIMAQSIDVVVESAIAEGLTPIEVAAILANRLKAACNAATVATGKDVLVSLKQTILK